MQTLRDNPLIARLAAVLVLALLVLAVLLPITPVRYPVPSRDSGVFLYTASRWLEGDIPYADVWDHKPPAIYVINALGLLIGGGSRWGVWVIEFGSLLAAACFGFDALRRIFSPSAALIASALWIIAVPKLLQGGNLTEEYALPLQFAALWLFIRSDRPHHFMLIGILGAFAFLLRQNLIGIWIAIAVMLLISRRWRDLAAMVIAAALVLILTALIFASVGALDDLWAAAFEYNFAYSAASLGERGRALLKLLPLMLVSPIFIAGIGTWLVVISSMMMGMHRLDSIPPIVRLSFIALPIEIVLATVSTKGLLHYYLAWLPILTILAAILAQDTRFKYGLVLLAVLSIVPLFRSTSLSTEHVQRLEAAALIEAETAPAETVLLWGAEARVNFMADRHAPTRFVYQYPLFEADSPLMPEFLADIAAAPPALIIDTAPSNTLVPPLDSAAALWEFVSTHYTLAGTVGPDAWRVFRYNDPP